jgi:hypothetical protein
VNGEKKSEVPPTKRRRKRRRDEEKEVNEEEKEEQKIKLQFLQADLLTEKLIDQPNEADEPN